jgi:hypothetical protein
MLSRSIADSLCPTLGAAKVKADYTLELQISHGLTIANVFVKLYI